MLGMPSIWLNPCNRRRSAQKGTKTGKGLNIFSSAALSNFFKVYRIEHNKSLKKPKFKKQYYENRLEVLEKELKEVQAELKLNKKDFLPLQKVQKTYARDEVKLRRQEALVVNQKVSTFATRKVGRMSIQRRSI